MGSDTSRVPDEVRPRVLGGKYIRGWWVIRVLVVERTRRSRVPTRGRATRIRNSIEMIKLLWATVDRGRSTLPEASGARGWPYPLQREGLSLISESGGL